MIDIEFLPASEIQRAALDLPEGTERLLLLADMGRLNTLASVKRMGTGVRDSGLGWIDIDSYLFYSEMNTLAVGANNPDRDIYFSSHHQKSVGYCSMLYGLGRLSEEQFLNLNDAGEAIELKANDDPFGGSVTQAIEKAIAKRDQNQGGRVFFMTGVEELIANRYFESPQPAVRQKVSNLYILIDDNTGQADISNSKQLPIENFTHMVAALGWQVARCNAHDYLGLAHAFDEFRLGTDKPNLLIADTLESYSPAGSNHLVTGVTNQGLYQQARDDESYLRAHAALWTRIQTSVAENGGEPLTLKLAPIR